MYDLLICLLDNSMRTITSAETQINVFKAVTVLRTIISNMKKFYVRKKISKKVFAEQENVRNVEILLKKEES